MRLLLRKIKKMGAEELIKSLDVADSNVSFLLC